MGEFYYNRETNDRTVSVTKMSQQNDRNVSVKTNRTGYRPQFLTNSEDVQAAWCNFWPGKSQRVLTSRA